MGQLGEQKGQEYGIDTKVGTSDITLVGLDLSAQQARQLIDTYSEIKKRDPRYDVLNYNCAQFVQEGLRNGINEINIMPSNGVPDVYARNLILQGWQVYLP